MSLSVSNWDRMELQVSRVKYFSLTLNLVIPCDARNLFFVKIH